MPRSSDFKDLRGAASTISDTPSRSAAPPNAGGEMDSATTPPRKGMQCAQVSDSVNRHRVTSIQYRRVVAELRDGHPEKKIAEGVGVPEPVVRNIRRAYMTMPERQMASMGLAFEVFFSSVRAMNGEIHDGIYEELNEGAA